MDLESKTEEFTISYACWLIIIKVRQHNQIKPKVQFHLVPIVILRVIPPPPSLMLMASSSFPFFRKQRNKSTNENFHSKDSRLTISFCGICNNKYQYQVFSYFLHPGTFTISAPTSFQANNLKPSQQTIINCWVCFQQNFTFNMTANTNLFVILAQFIWHINLGCLGFNFQLQDLYWTLQNYQAPLKGNLTMLFFIFVDNLLFNILQDSLGKHSNLSS